MNARRSDTDPRTYIRVHDGMPDHPKVERLSDAAFRLLMETWCWCSRNLTDGHVPAASWKKRRTAKVRQELVDAGLAEVLENGDIYMHDYPEHQRTAAEVRALRTTKSKSGARGMHTRWHTLRGVVDPDCEYCAGLVPDSKAITGVIADGQQTDSGRIAETETETETDITTPPSPPRGKRGSRRAAYDYDKHPDFVRFWNAYPEKAGKAAALKAWLDAIDRGHDPELIIQAAYRYRTDPRRNPEKTKHPQGWLNDERFLDQATSQNAETGGGWWNN